MVEILKAGTFEIVAISHGLKGENPLQLIELAGRVSYQSQDRITGTSAAKFVEMLRKRGHESVLEFSSMTVRFDNISRGFAHELVRHRLASFVQESTRRVDESDFKVVIPPTKDPDERFVELVLPNEGSQKTKISFREWMALNEQMYRGLREAGWACEDARQVLPIGIKSQITIKANLREWRHIFKLRCARNAHWEIRGIMLNLLKEVQKIIPIVFDDFKFSKEGQSAAITSS